MFSHAEPRLWHREGSWCAVTVESPTERKSITPIQFYLHRKLRFLFQIGWNNNSYYKFIHLYFISYFIHTSSFCNASRSMHKLCKIWLIAADLAWAKLQSGKRPPVSKRTTSTNPTRKFFLHARSLYQLGNSKVQYLAQLHWKFEVVLKCGTEATTNFCGQPRGAPLMATVSEIQLAACKVQPLRSPGNASKSIITWTK